MKEYKLIPLVEITPEAREIAVKWVEGLDTSGQLNIMQKHKLASDIMNYAEDYRKERIKMLSKIMLWGISAHNYGMSHISDSIKGETSAYDGQMLESLTVRCRLEAPQDFDDLVELLNVHKECFLLQGEPVKSLHDKIKQNR